eukprot:jgi/Bigna1/146642/aug1.118_g21350
MERRWAYFAISIFVSTCCAVNYAFAVLTDTLKDDFHFTQTQVDFVGKEQSTCGNLGQYFGFIAGLVFDKYGPRVSLTVAAFLLLTGFGSLAIALSGAIPHPTLGMVAFFYFIGSHSQPWLDNAAIVTNISNFPQHTGLVVGLGKAFNGLGASVLSLIYSGAFAPNAVLYLVFLSIFPTVVALVAASIARIVDHQAQIKPCYTGRLLLGYGVAILLMIYLASISIYESSIEGGVDSTTKAVCAGALVVFYGAFLYIPFSFSKRTAELMKEGSNDDDDNDDDHHREATSSTPGRHYTKLAPGSDLAINRGGGGHVSYDENNNEIEELKAGGRISSKDDEEEEEEEEEGRGSVNSDDDGIHEETHGGYVPLLGETNVWQAICTMEFWLVFTATTIIAGSGLAVINNVAQIVEALNGGKKDSSTTGVFVTIIASGSASGRLAVGAIASAFKSKRQKWQILLCISAMLMTAACCFLGWMSQVVPLLLDLYGMCELAAIYSAVNFAPMLGSLCIATYIFGTFYDIEKRHQGKADSSDEACIGIQCFQTGFMILSGLGIFAIACTYLLYCRCYAACRGEFSILLQYQNNQQQRDDEVKEVEVVVGEDGR